MEQTKRELDQIKYIKKFPEMTIYLDRDIQKLIQVYEKHIPYTWAIYSGYQYGGYSNGGSSHIIAYVTGSIDDIIKNRELYPWWIRSYDDCDGFSIGKLEIINVMKLKKKTS